MNNTITTSSSDASDKLMQELRDWLNAMKKYRKNNLPTSLCKEGRK